MSPFYTPATSKPATNPSFYGQLRTTWDNEAPVKILGLEVPPSHQTEIDDYRARCDFAQSIKNDMHAERLAGMTHDADGHVCGLK